MGTLAKVAIGLLIAFVVLAGAALLFSARPTPLIGLDGDSLGHSIRSSSGECRKGPDSEWVCAIEGDNAMTRYRVDVGWSGCWDADRFRGPATDQTPESISGCVDIWDHLALEKVFD